MLKNIKEHCKVGSNVDTQVKMALKGAVAANVIAAINREEIM